MFYHDVNNSVDPCFGLPSLVLHMEGENGATAFIDSSANTFTMTPIGSAQLSTAQKRFGNTSGLFSNTNLDAVQTSDNTALDLSTGAPNWTIEAWVYLTATPANSIVIIDKDGVQTTNLSSYQLGYNPSGSKFYILIGDSSGAATSQTVTGATTVSLNTWYHVAAMRSGSVLYLYVNGILDGSATISITMVNGGRNLSIGRRPTETTVNTSWRGHIDEVVIWKGNARYTGNPGGTGGIGVGVFTPQSSARPGPAYPQPKLLLHLNGNTGLSQSAFIDHSISNKTAAGFNGATTSATQSKFNGTSASFDGINKYGQVNASADFNFGTGDFTIETWFYTAGNSAQAPAAGNVRHALLFGLDNGTDATGCFEVVLTGDTTTTGVGIGVTQQPTGAISGATVSIPQNVWHHLALTRQGNTFKVFLNGTQVGTSTSSVAVGSSTFNAHFGGRPISSFPYYFNGFMQELVVWKGFAKYTTNFTPPQEQYSNGVAPSTVLLMHMDSGDQSTVFGDSSTYARGITVNGGSKQTVANNNVELGRSCAQFTAGGDYLQLAAATNWDLSNCDFTIECWVRQTISAAGHIITWRDASTAKGMQIGSGFSSSKLNFTFGCGAAGATSAFDATCVSPTVYGLNQWYHLAATKKGTKLRFYVDGEETANNVFGGVIANTGNATCIAASFQTPSTNSPFNGQMDEIRVVRGAALYDGNFSRPTCKMTDFNPKVIWDKNNRSTNATVTLTDSYRQMIVAASTGVWRSAKATLARNSGKFYYEIIVNSTSTDGSNIVMGIADANAAVDSNFVGNNANTWGYWGNSTKYVQGTPTFPYGSTYTTGDTIGVGVDWTANTITFFKNGTSQGVAASTGITGVTLFPMISLQNTATIVGRFSRESVSFLPSGYTPWDGY